MALESPSRKTVLMIFFMLAIVSVGVLKKNEILGPKRQTLALKRGDIIEAVFGVGVVKSKHIFQYKIGTPSRLIRQMVASGDTVKKDQPMLELENIGVVKAPFDGTVSQLNFNLGETIFAQVVILELTDYNAPYLEVAVDERSSVLVKPGMIAEITFDAHRGKVFTGSVTSIYASNGQFLVKIQFNHEDVQTLPGLSADVAIKIREIKDQLLVPVTAMQQKNQVEVIRNNALVVEKIKTDISDGTFTNLVEGNLSEGEELVIKPVDAKATTN